MSKKIIVCCVILFYSLVLSSYARAEKSKHHKPPKEAFEACENKAEGEEVSFTTPRGDQITASCKLMKQVLIAIPLNHKKPENHGYKRSEEGESSQY